MSDESRYGSWFIDVLTLSFYVLCTREGPDLQSGLFPYVVQVIVRTKKTAPLRVADGERMGLDS